MVWFIIGLILFFGFFGGFFFLWKIPQISVNDKVTTMPSISIIIPARNEEKSLPHLLQSLKDQSLSPLEIIVVDDESTDRTAAVAEAFGATVLSAAEAELKHKGKSAACWIGAKKAKGDWFIFLDSDTYFVHKHALRSISETYIEKNESGLLSIQPYHEIEHVYETLSIVLNIIVMAGLNRFSFLNGKLPHRGAFGPFLLTTQEQYEEVGGHYAIMDSHMDDIELAKLFKGKGWPVFVYGGKQAIHFRMFPGGFTQLVNGWTKSLIHGAKGTHPAIHITIGFWITGVFVASFLLFFSVTFVNTLSILLFMTIYISYCIQFRCLMNKVGTFPLWTIFVPIIYISVFLFLYLWAVVQVYIVKKVRWRDREINT